MKKFRGKRIVALLLMICMLVGMLPTERTMAADAVSGLDSLTCSSFISNTEHRNYIDTMMRYYINNYSSLSTTLNNGNSVIFMFEGGSDNYPSYDYELDPSNTRNQAVCIVVQLNSSGNAEIVYYCEECSSIPGNPQLCTYGVAYSGSTTLLDGIYSVYTWNHTGPYGALQVNTSQGYYTPSSYLDGYTSGASGINIHTRSTMSAGGTSWSWQWSEGCQVIGTGAYESNEFNGFMKAVAGISYNVWLDYINKYFNTITTGTTVGYYVLDRQLGYEGLGALYNDTALANITAFSTAAAEEGMASYVNQCTSYPSHCQIKVTGSTSVMSQPCSSSTDSTSTKIETASTGTVYEATRLYMNTAGNLWYQVISKTGEVGYIVANKTSYVKQILTDITISGESTPNGHVAGDVFYVEGIISSSYNLLTSVAAYVYSGFGTSGTQVTGYSDDVNGTYYSLVNSTIDYNTAFNDLSTGNYTYAISADYKNYYATGNSTYSANTGTVYLTNEYFMVVSSEVDQSSCSHTYTDYVITAATCTEAGTKVTACTTCGLLSEKAVSAAGHSYGSWTTVTAKTCTTDGLQKRTCSSCGNVETKTLTATGHDYEAEAVEANCIQYAHTVYTCSECGDSYITYDEDLYTDWQTDRPEGVSEDLIDTKIQYRYATYDSTTSTSTSLDGYTQTGSSWQQKSTGTVTYVKEWPDGFDTSSDIYSTYNKTPKTASESTSSKTTITGDEIVGYIYYHWCQNSYTAGPINRGSKPAETGAYTTFHAFYSTTDPDSLYQVTDDDGVSHQYENGDCCTDTYWYFVVPVYKQSYTTYQKVYTYERWSDWSDWSDTEYTASATQKVETQTLYRYIDAEYGDHNFVDGICTICGEEEDTSGCNHSYGQWYIETAPTCTTDGVKKRTCSLCGKEQSQVLSAIGHDYTAKTVAPTCIAYEYTIYTCENCGDTYKVYIDESYGEWSTTKPEGIDEGLIESKTQYRYSDYETKTSTSSSLDGYTQTGSSWQQKSTGTVTYVKEWPDGFSTSSSLYSTYNKTPKTASETTSAKTVINSDEVVGYLYYHWCYDDSTYSTEYTTGSYTTFHAYYSTVSPDNYACDTSDYSYKTSDTCCSNSNWFFVAEVYEQSYTTYEKVYTFEGWSDWSDWSDTEYTASSTRKVETQTLYRYANAGYADHNYVNGVCTVCGAIKPVIVCDHENHDVTGTCTNCGESVEHTYSNGVCTICGKECDHSFVSGVCTICGLKQETSVNLSTYLSYCGDYASNLSVKTTKTTSLMSYPCSSAVQANATVKAKVLEDTVLFVKALYENTVGEYWYQILRYGETYYVKAADTTLLDHLIGDVSGSDMYSPATLGYGNVFPIGGTITSELNELTTITVSMYSGADTTKTPVITASDTASNNSYTLDSSTIDNNLAFNSLSAGAYTYLVTADAVSYYVDDNDSLSTVTKTVIVEDKECMITNASSPNTKTAFGIDVSTWQGTIDWASVATQVDFAILRASYETTADTQFINNADGCTENGIPFGVYVYSYAENEEEAIEEAEFVLSLVSGYDLALPIFFDIEDSVHTALSSSEKKAVVKAFADTIYEAGYQPGLYTFLSWFNSYFSSDYYFNTLPKWVAQVGTSYCTYTGGVTMWQYSWTGSFNGISGDVDCNYYYGEFPGVNTDTSYLSQCTSYPSNLDVTTKSSTALMKYPCSSSTNSTSTTLSTLAASTELHVTGLYKNTANELWYQVEYGDTCGYVLAKNTNVNKFRYDDVAVVDPVMSSNLSVGSACYLEGELVSQYNEMTAVYAKVYSGEDTLATPYIESGDSETTRSYNLYKSDVDYGLAFNKLVEGYYTYEISADVTNYYVNSSGTLTSETENVVVWVSPLTVGSSTISHTHTQVTDKAVAATCTSTGLTAGSHCSTCNEIITEQSVVSVTRHTEGTAVRENEVTGSSQISYDEVVYCTVCGTEISRYTVTIDICDHEAHDQGGICTNCGETVEHTFKNGSCTVCGLACEHNWDDDTCTICGETRVITFTVTFVDYDGTVLSTQTVERGTAATAPASPSREGYKFTGWDTSFDNITADVTVTAQYVYSLGKLKVAVNGGSGFTMTIDNGTARNQGTSYVNSKMPVGSYITVTAKTTNDNEFLGWLDPANGKILSTELTYSFYTGGNDYIEAVYKSEVEGTNFVIFINDKSGQYFDMQYYTADDEIVFPDAPVQTGYDFAGWDHTEEEIKAELAAGKDVVVTAEWTVRLVYVDITVNGGTIVSHGGQNDAGQYLASKAVTVEADAAETGMKFAYWKDGNGDIRGYETTYKFYPGEDIELTAVYVDEDETIEREVLVYLDSCDTSGTYGTFLFSWYVPEEENGLTYQAAGIVAVNKDYYKANTLYHGTTDANVYDRSATGSSNTASNTYAWVGPLSSGQTWVAMAWVQYTDADGNTVVEYSEIFEVTKY